MPELSIVVDTSCLIALNRIDHLNLLHLVYNKITITPEIKAEYKLELPDWIEVSLEFPKELEIINSIVDDGEASAIKYCLKKKESLLIIDDNKGRKLARKLGIKVTGTLGVLAKAKRQGKLGSVKPSLELLKKHGFRFDQKLEALILQIARES